MLQKGFMAGSLRLEDHGAYRQVLSHSLCSQMDTKTYMAISWLKNKAIKCYNTGFYILLGNSDSEFPLF